MFQASTAIQVSPGARAYYDKQSDRGVGYNAALRQLDPEHAQGDTDGGSSKLSGV